MIKKVLLSLIAVIFLCTCAYAGTWRENAENWAAGAWKATKDFFSEDVPSYFNMGVEKAKAWWNDLDFNKDKVESLRKEVAELNMKFDAFMKSFKAGEIRASGFAGASGNNDFVSRDAELKEKELALNKRERELKIQTSSRKRELDSREENITQREQTLNERENSLKARTSLLNREIASRDAELTRKEKSMRDYADQRNAELDGREHAVTERETQTNLRSEKLISYEAMLKKSADKLHEEARKINDFNRRQNEAPQKASAVLAKLRENNYLSKFIDAGMLDKIDIEKFMLNDKNYGAMDIHYTPYGTLNANFDTSKYGFIDSILLKNTLKSLFRSNTLSLHGDSEVILVLSDDKTDGKSQIESISNNAFFTFESLVSELGGHSPLSERAASEIESFLKINEQNGKLRFFFRTEHKGLYVIAVLPNEKSSPAVYLAADSSQKLIRKRDLPRELRRRIKLMNLDREAVLNFAPESKIDVYLDMFVKGLVDKIPDYKDSF